MIDGDEIQLFEFKVQSKNDSNLTTLFLPNEVLRAKPTSICP